MTITNDSTPNDTEVDSTVDRRRMLRNVSIAAAAAAVGGAALSSQNAGAVDPFDIQRGTDNPTTAPTSLIADTGYTAAAGDAGVFHVTNAAAAVLPDAAATVAITAVVDEDEEGGLGTGFYALATDTGAVFDAPIALHLLDTVSTTAPDLTTGVAGQFRQVDGALWYCAQGNAGTQPAVWLQLASPMGAGGLVPINPVRVYDSRQSTPGGGAISQTQNRVVSVASGRGPTGAITALDAIPAGAKAIAFNVTVTETTGTFGYLSIVPGDVTTTPVTSSVNWDGPGRTVANSGIVRIAADRTVRVFGADAAAVSSAQFIIDVTGYYL